MNEKFDIKVTTNDEPATLFNNRSIPLPKNMAAPEKVNNSIIGITKSCKSILEDKSGFSKFSDRIELVAGSFILEIKRLIYKAFYKKYVEDEGKLKIQCTMDFCKSIHDSSIEESIYCLRNIIVTCIRNNEHINWEMVNVAKSNMMLSFSLIGYEISDNEIYNFINAFVKMVEGAKVYLD